MADVAVFLGPTLGRAEAGRKLPGARILPPVRLGDVCAAVYDGTDVLVIIDGIFEQVPTVWHKEILWALSRGCWVYGAASMGAMRAAELECFGMRGVGGIYQRFLSGVYNDDDEVAVVHAPGSEGYRPLSTAMVNIRAGLEQATAGNVITAAQAAGLCAAAKKLYYPHRSWEAVLAAAPGAGLPSATVATLRAWLRTAKPDAKRSDAAEALLTVRRDLAAGFEPRPAGFEFEPTYTFVKLQTMVRARRAEEALAQRNGRSSAELRAASGSGHLPLYYLLVAREAERLGLTVGEIGEANAGRVAQQAGVPVEVAAKFLRLEAAARLLEDRHLLELSLFTELPRCVPAEAQPSGPDGQDGAAGRAAVVARAPDGR